MRLHNGHGNGTSPKIVMIPRGQAIGVPGKAASNKRKIGSSTLHIKINKERAENSHALYPPDCYGPYNGVPYNTHILLLDEDPYDMVAKLENADLAGLDIPWEFQPKDLLVAFVPPRRAIAFAYTVLRPSIGYSFSKACKTARIPEDWYADQLYRNPLIMQFCSNFWRERVTAMAGIAFIYADQHSRLGSAPHLKLLAELTKQIDADKPNQTQNIQINMPDHPQNQKKQKQLTGKTIDADAELFDEPA